MIFNEQDPINPGTGGFHPSYRLKLASLVLPLVLFIFMVSALELAIRSNQSQLRSQQLQQLGKDVANVGRLLEQELNASIYLLNGLQAYVESKGGVLVGQELAPWLTNLQTRSRHIRNIGLAPGNRIAYIFPLEGNEKALGLYYPDNLTQWPAVEKVIQSRIATLIGPIPLQQGGQGLIYRSPVYLDGDTYWGIISVVINADTLFNRLMVDADEHNFSLHIIDLGSSETIAGQNITTGYVQADLAINLPGRQWKLIAAAEPIPMSPTLTSLRIGGWLVAIACMILLARFFQEVKARAQTLLTLRESQQRFARMFTTSPQGLALLDNNGQWIEVNPSLYRILDYNLLDFEHLQFVDIFAKESQPQVVDQMQDIRNQYATQANHSCQFEANLVRGNGELFTGFITLGICYRHQEETHWLLQVLDISERTRLDQLKNEFVSVVSHELRTPLTSIMGSLKLLESGQLQQNPASSEKILQIAVQNSERLARLINDLLDMDKLIAGKIEFELKECDLLPLIEKTLESFRPYALQHQVSYKLLAPDESLFVRVDTLRLQQVITNLLSNAAKFSPPNSEIIIAVTSEPQQVRIQIQDQGEGIAEEDQQKLFKKFSQIDSSSTRHKGGSGLGLAISKELIERMGGHIGVNSSLGAGSCFYVTLPRSNTEH